MSDAMTPGPTHRSLRDEWRRAGRYYFGNRRALLAIGALALVLAVAFNWSWLVAAGIAPILLAGLPCAVMCALGLCAASLCGRSRVGEPDRPMGDLPPQDRVAAESERSALNREHARPAGETTDRGGEKA